MGMGTCLVGDSSTMSFVLAEDTVNLAHKAVQFTEDGQLEVAESGDTAIGLTTGAVDAVEVSGEKITYGGTSVTVLVKNRGLAMAGTALEYGELLSVDEDGCVVSYSGDGVPFARGFSSCHGAGELVLVKLF